MANIIIPVLDMVKKMLENKDPADKILTFLKGSTPIIYCNALREDIIECKGCGLHECNHTPPIGDIHSEVMFIGEA